MIKLPLLTEMFVMYFESALVLIFMICVHVK